MVAEVLEGTAHVNTAQTHQLYKELKDSLCFQNYFTRAVATGHTSKKRLHENITQLKCGPCSLFRQSWRPQLQ